MYCNDQTGRAAAITGLNTSTIIWLDNSTIKRIQTKVTLTQRGSRETRNQRLSGKHLSIILYEFRLYLNYHQVTLKVHN